MSKFTTFDQTQAPPTPVAGRTTYYTTSLGAFIISTSGVTKLSVGITIRAVVSISDPSPELNALAGLQDGDLLVAVQVVTNGLKLCLTYGATLDGGC